MASCSVYNYSACRFCKSYVSGHWPYYLVKDVLGFQPSGVYGIFGGVGFVVRFVEVLFGRRRSDFELHVRKCLLEDAPAAG